MKKVRLGYGVAAPTPIRCPKAEESLKGAACNDAERIENYVNIALTEVRPRSSWRASKEFRLQVISELAKRAFKGSHCFTRRTGQCLKLFILR